MPIYKAPVEDVTFLLNDVFQIDRYDNLSGFSDASADVREAIISEAAKLAEEVLQPLNRVGDLEGCKRHDDSSVTTPKGFKEAYKQLTEGGWLGLSAPTEYGGQGLPGTLSQCVTEFQSAANMAFSMYGGLTMGATAAFIVHGKPGQKERFVAKVVAGERWWCRSAWATGARTSSSSRWAACRSACLSSAVAQASWRSPPGWGPVSS